MCVTNFVGQVISFYEYEYTYQVYNKVIVIEVLIIFTRSKMKYWAIIIWICHRFHFPLFLFFFVFYFVLRWQLNNTYIKTPIQITCSNRSTNNKCRPITTIKHTLAISISENKLIIYNFCTFGNSNVQQKIIYVKPNINIETIYQWEGKPSLTRNYVTNETKNINDSKYSI